MGELADMLPNDEEYYFDEPILSRRGFVWIDKDGNEHKLSSINNYYLNNIINFLKQKDNSIFEGTIKFLEKEAMRRSKETANA